MLRLGHQARTIAPGGRPRLNYFRQNTRLLRFVLLLRRVYRTYWNRVVEAWGPRPITSVSPLEISQLAEDIKANVVARRNARGGRGAAEHLIGALRCMYSHAVADRLLSEAENPAARVPKPRRLPSARMALPDGRLAEISAVAASTGDDPALDSLIIRLHAETACRRGGALALTPEDLDPEQCLIRLHEKGGTERWQPVSPTLMAHLLAHAEGRGGLESRERVLRYATGRPITTRRYDYLWDRLGEHLPWVKTQQVSTHWIRHTILTWVERRFGFAVAQAYAGHQNTSQGARAMGATGTYVRAGCRGRNRALRPDRRAAPPCAGRIAYRHQPLFRRVR